MGKLSNENLKKLLNCIKKDPRVIVPPMPGFDSGVHLIGDKYLVVSTDPCIGVPEEWFGWFLIHYAASDVALFGAKPEFCTINLLGSPTTTSETFIKTMNQACKAAEELKVAIVTGHTGTYEELPTLLGTCTTYGTVEKEKLITPAGAKPGDHILCVKPVGLETVVNFSLTHKTLAERLFGEARTAEMHELVKLQSCVPEAMLLSEIGGVHAMHDATEGGLTAAFNEMAEASDVGFEIEWEHIPIANELVKLAEGFHLSWEQVLSTSSTGTILAAVSPDAKENVMQAFGKYKIEGKILGVFTKNKKRVLVKEGTEMTFPAVADDPYTRILSGKL